MPDQQGAEDGPFFMTLRGSLCRQKNADLHRRQHGHLRQRVDLFPRPL